MSERLKQNEEDEKDLRERERERESAEWFTCIASIAPTQGQIVCETEDPDRVGTSFLL